MTVQFLPTPPTALGTCIFLLTCHVGSFGCTLFVSYSVSFAVVGA